MNRICKTVRSISYRRSWFWHNIVWFDLIWNVFVSFNFYCRCYLTWINEQILIQKKSKIKTKPHLKSLDSLFPYHSSKNLWIITNNPFLSMKENLSDEEWSVSNILQIFLHRLGLRRFPTSRRFILFDHNKHVACYMLLVGEIYPDSCLLTQVLPSLIETSYF